MTVIVDLNGRQIDISGAFPLKIRDWKVLERNGIDMVNGQLPITKSAEIVFYVLNQRDPSVTREEIDDLPLAHPAYQAVLQALQESTAVTDDPLPT